METRRHGMGIRKKGRRTPKMHGLSDKESQLLVFISLSSMISALWPGGNINEAGWTWIKQTSLLLIGSFHELRRVTLIRLMLIWGKNT